MDSGDMVSGLTKNDPNTHGSQPVSGFLDRQERDWRSGKRSSIDEILAEFPSLADSADGLLDLIENELVLRSDAGEKPALEEYLNRFPQVADALRVQ